MSSPRRRVPLGAIAAALYALSLAMPAIVVMQQPLLWGSARPETMYGVQCLLIGWMTVPWYANVLLLIAALGLSFQRPALAIGCAIGALVLGLSTFAFLGPDLRTAHVGFFAWLASMALVLAAGCAAPRPGLEAWPEIGPDPVAPVPPVPEPPGSDVQG